MQVETFAQIEHMTMVPVLRQLSHRCGQKLINNVTPDHKGSVVHFSPLQLLLINTLINQEGKRHTFGY